MTMTDERRNDLGRFISGPRKSARPSVRKPAAEIARDPNLTEEQRSTLVRIYQSSGTANAAAGTANAAAGTANAASESPLPGGG